MKISRFVRLKLKRTLAGIISILVLLAAAVPVQGAVQAQEPSPRIVASITYNWFQAENFPGSSVHLQVYDEPGGALLWEETRSLSDSGYVTVEEWEHFMNLVPGQVIVASAGAIVKELVLEAVTLDTFDPAADYMAGTAPLAPGGRLVWAGAGNEDTGCGLEVTADPTTGAWTADFTTQPCDITEDMWAAAQVFDADGDASEANLLPVPRFTLFPEWEWFDAHGWPEGAAVTITVEGKAECGVVREAPGTFFNGSFGEGCNLEIGDTVTFTNGATTQTHTVRNLDVTLVNAQIDLVKGVADPGTVVYVWPHDPTVTPLQAVANGSGVWRVDFEKVGYDIQEDTVGRSEIRDENGNATAVDWYVLQPRFSAFPLWDRIEGWDWRPETTVRLIIDDPATPGRRDFTQRQPVVPTPWDPDGWWVLFEFAGAYDLKVGDVVTLTDGRTERTHTVQNLAITAVDEEADTVAGSADPNAEIHVWPHATGQQIVATADNQGNWQVDFAGVFDLQPGEAGRAEVRDAQGNATAVDWRVPYPHFTVFSEWEAVEGYDWPQGATLTASLEGNPACVAEGVADYPEWDPFNTFVFIPFPAGCDVQAGDVVSLTDGALTLTHTVQNLAVTGVDAAEDLVSGTADADALIDVWPHATGQQMQVQAGPTGTWQADFTGTFDIAPGDAGRSQIRDEAGNATAVDWYARNPHIVASIPEDWFYVNEFTPNTTLEFSVYSSPGGSLIWEGTAMTDDFGGAWVDAEGHWDFEPGIYLVVSDGTYTKELVIEGFTFDVFDVRRGRLKGTAPAPFGRRVWVGIGFGQDGWFMDVTTNRQGKWIADFGAPVPPGYDWVAAQIFDADGDATELRPARIRE